MSGQHNWFTQRVDWKYFFSYQCSILVTVETGGGQGCYEGRFIELDGRKGGYLASIVTEDTQKGLHSCPWLISVLPGQQLNITLVDFTQVVGGGCQAYASFKERSSEGQPQTVCGGDGRERHAFLSNSESVEVRLFQSSPSKPKRFLLKYEGKWLVHAGRYRSVVSLMTSVLSMTWESGLMSSQSSKRFMRQDISHVTYGFVVIENSLYNLCNMITSLPVYSRWHWESWALMQWNQVDVMLDGKG